VIYGGHEGLHEGDPVVPTRCGPSGPLTVPPAAGEAPLGTVYTCPMHPEVKSDTPGDCPECGMRLEPAAAGSRPQPSPAGAAAPAQAPAATGGAPPRGYICPMDPGVHSDHPAKCPKCGMDLEPAPAKGGAR